MKRRIFLIWVGLCLAGIGFSGCGNSQEPVLFLPKVSGPESVDLESQRELFCRGVAIDLTGDLLQPETFRAIFRCANYDQSLEGLRPLFLSEEFPAFLRNLNRIFGSKGAADLRETLRGWLEEGADGTSRLDRLLPILAEVIKHPSFQEALPLFHRLLDAGREVWPRLLPGLADVVYQERFPDTMADLFALFRFGKPEGDSGYSTEAKRWAALAQADVGGKTAAAGALDLAYRLREIRLPGTSLLEYLDLVNENGVFVSLYLDSGLARGETIDPKLNATPDEEEMRDGLNLTPWERQDRAFRRLFTSPSAGEAPIVQLAGLVAEFQQPHPDFVPAIARWFAANGPRVSRGLTEYVVRAQVISSLPRLSLEEYLLAFAAESGRSPGAVTTAPEFEAFLREAFAAPGFSRWLESRLLELNRDQFGSRNARLLEGSGLGEETLALYRLPPVAAFGTTLVPAGKRVTLGAATKRFSNLHRRGDQLRVDFGGKLQAVAEHLEDLWWGAAERSLGEGVALDFAIQLAQTLLTEMSGEISGNGLTLSEWFFASPYGNPGSTEALAGYGVYELDLLTKLREHRAYILGAFAEEVFPDESDRRAFRMLVEQAPNLWLYVKSGLSRSGNDLTRALAGKEGGYLSRGYVALLTSAVEAGWLRDGARLVEAYLQHFPAAPEPEPYPSGIEERRRVSMGADALKRVLRALFEPQIPGDPQTSTLGRLLVPLSSLVEPEERGKTTRFLLTSARELERAEDAVLDDFFRDLFEGGSLLEQRETMRSLAEMLKDPVFPEVIRQVRDFFAEDAVKPALDFLAEKIDDGTLPDVLLFVRRILGFAR